MNLDLGTRVALVTNADCEAGRVVAAALSAEGALVGLHSSTEAQLEASISAVGADALPLAGMSTADAVAALAARAGRCDIAVAVLPALPEGAIATVGDDATLYDAWRHVEETAATFRAALPIMQAAGWGRCLFVGPVEAKAFTQRSADLDRSVGLAILGMQKALSGEVGPLGVTANSILWDSVPPAHVSREDLLQAVGATAAYLASPYADFIDGVTIAVDGAMTMGTY